MNIDPQEIEKFEAMAHSWWDEQGEFKALHQLNPVRLDWITEKCDGLFDKKILDVGCGGGLLSEGMARRGAKVTGIDMGREPLAIARLHALEQGVELDYRQMTAEECAEQHSGEFDVVTCMEMLEHVPDPASVIRACAKLVRPGGLLFFSTINRTLKARMMIILAAEYILKMVPKKTHDYRKFITPAELSVMAEAANLVVEDMAGTHYQPLFGIFKLHPNVDVNYMLACRKPD
ncbi:bifunctional 2-polyprenyl-6-hydroxyphenol methylase/3-demethylubiquinol 3-O-methyltransferase UbiG [Dongshaea marina]|uniref:bifunctional 2-polyprenyl-6-hydroxyphenol methylase/3-demethylubiquinol 3-O-methyltransferase UbiG n=1 Tax=Dongshaea marina TaxID=2047966 RepID=UPI000D3EC91F|nr:bifunctional 2-polyprenyl-6-hydroxyphenol methylase/3-demethylubiquinol 3-O-methyltransferase UbiG [Dongshaea marina]